MVEHQTLNLGVLGSNPSFRKYNAGMMELVDMLGLEPSALRCAGSSPVPGTILKNHSLNCELSPKK